MGSLLVSAVGAAILLVGAGSGVAAAAPGDLDPSFGDGGTVVTAEAVRAYVGDVVPTGAGVFEISGTAGLDASPSSWTVRLRDAAGGLDMSYGVEGAAPVPDGYSLTGPVAGVVDDERRLLVAGSQLTGSGREIGALVRYLPDGQVDRSFAGDGVRTLRDSLDRSSHARAVISDGRRGEFVVRGGTRWTHGELSYPAASVRLREGGRFPSLENP